MNTRAQATQRACQRIPERTRCEPEFARGHQCGRCAMTDRSRHGTVVDASVLKREFGSCPMFVDARGAGLRLA